MASSYKNGSIYMLKLIFSGELEPWECFEKLFRTVDMKRLNGLSIIGSTKKGVVHEKMHYVKMKGENYDLLQEISEAIKSTGEIMAHILYEAIDVSPYRGEKGEMLLATISNNKIKQENKGLDAVMRGFREAEAKEPFSSDFKFKEFPCRYCGEDTMDFGFCSSCNKQVKKISAKDMVLLSGIVGYLVILTIIFIRNIWGLPWNNYKIIFMGVSLLRLSGYLSGLIFTYRYRKIGFYILLGTKIADSFIRMTALGTNISGFLIETAGTLVFIYAIKYLTEKHLPYMKSI